MDKINIDRLLWVDVRNGYGEQLYLYKGHKVIVIGQIWGYYELEKYGEYKPYFEKTEDFLNNARELK